MLLALLACASPGPLAARAAWIQERLTEDNRWWLTRSPSLVETKYARMDADVYDWMRGTAGLFLADGLRPDPDRAPTAFLVDPDAAAVLVVGDPHVENLGTCLPGAEPDPGVAADGELPLEWVDLDGAAYGPWTVDTRRAALGIALVADAIEGCDGCVDRAVDAFARAYAAEIVAQGEGRGWAAAAETEHEGAVVADLRAGARADGSIGAELDEYTVVEADERGIGVRRLARDERLAEDGDGVLALRAREEAQLARLLAVYDAPPDFRVLDAARLYGKGVASLPATRYLVLWDTGHDGLEDDRLLALREVIDPPTVDGMVPGLGAVYRDNAERIEAVATTLWSRPDADARLDGIADGATAFKATTVSGWFQTFDHADVPRLFAVGVAADSDLDAFAATVGRALAAAHARGTTLDGAPSLPVIAGDLAAGGGADTLAEERVRDAAADLETLHADHALFRALRADVGPLLGAEALP